MIALNKKLREAGELVGARAVGPRPGQAGAAPADGAPVTDGVFPESKEFLAGYWIVDVDSPARAYAIAAEASARPARRRADEHGRSRSAK
jgi:hypothetical protein